MFGFISHTRTHAHYKSANDQQPCDKWCRVRDPPYLDYPVEDLLRGLVLAIAEVAVCVHVVVVAVQSDGQEVLPLQLLAHLEGELGGGPAQVHGPHGAGTPGMEQRVQQGLLWGAGGETLVGHQ